MRDASTIHHSGVKKKRSGYLHPSSLVTPYELAILNKKVEQRRDEHKSASSNARGNLNSCPPSLLGEQTYDLEQARTEVIPSLPGGAELRPRADADGSHTLPAGGAELRPRADADGSHTLPARGEQNSDLEQTRTEVIWTEYRQVDGTEHPARFRTSRGVDLPGLLLRGCPSQYRAGRGPSS